MIDKRARTGQKRREERKWRQTQSAVCKQQLCKHGNTMTHKISARNDVLFKSWLSHSSSQGVRTHKGQTLSTPADLHGEKKRKKKDHHTSFFFSVRSCKWHEISNNTDPTYRNGKDWAVKADHCLPFLSLQCWPGSCRGIPGEEMLKGRNVGMGGVNQQDKRQLNWSGGEESSRGQGWSKCQHTEEMVSLQSREQKGHSISF